MRGSLSALASVMATASRGLRSRLLLTTGSMFLVAIAVAAAVVGPMYQSASAESFLVTKLRAEPDFVTGLTVNYVPETPVTGERWDEQALGAVDPSAVRQFLDPELSAWAEDLPVKTWAGLPGGQPQARLLAGSGDCHRLVVTDRCPHRPDEILMLEADATYTHTRVGDRLEVSGL
ncbi:MAG: hypothetical protein M3Q17_00125, partial [Actinomycetota bacterium]|nr:hypothetical protein [Actinomycetota bacterium]